MKWKILSGFLALLVVAACLPVPHEPGAWSEVDDWEYDSAPQSADGSRFGLVATKTMAMESSDIGFSVGGAKDADNFRANIRNGYLPMPTDITSEGLFYDYYFDTGESDRCYELFCPSYSSAITPDPLSNETEYYLSVGLNSGITDFKRKKLNLVVVLDISGSMSSPFNRYYYDGIGNRIENEEYTDDSKMEVARESVASLLDHLNDDDRFGMVLFDNNAHLAKPLGLVGRTDMEGIKEHILDLEPRGGTHMSAGMKMGTELFDDVEPEPEYENRIIFLTDAMPNIGETGEGSLLDILRDNSDDGIYTTFIGIGVDFNTELVEMITKTRGANYYSVHSARDFGTRMDMEFEFMVTPLVFDLELILDARGYEIERVYGSPEADEATGELMKVRTLFPSAKTDSGTRGGIVLLKLKKISDDAELVLSVGYEDRDGNQFSNERSVEFTARGFDNNGIRKGVLLSRYADLMKNWIIDTRNDRDDVLHASVNFDDGIVVPQLGRWERQSVSLSVSRHYERVFEDFLEHFEEEADIIGDEALHQEIDIMEKLTRS
ncbi:MAG: VWA domain-containing protein [archaeon]